MKFQDVGIRYYIEGESTKKRIERLEECLLKYDKNKSSQGVVSFKDDLSEEEKLMEENYMIQRNACIYSSRIKYQGIENGFDEVSKSERGYKYKIYNSEMLLFGFLMGDEGRLKVLLNRLNKQKGSEKEVEIIRYKLLFMNLEYHYDLSYGPLERIREKIKKQREVLKSLDKLLC